MATLPNPGGNVRRGDGIIIRRGSPPPKPMVQQKKSLSNGNLRSRIRRRRRPLLNLHKPNDPKHKSSMVLPHHSNLRLLRQHNRNNRHQRPYKSNFGTVPLLRPVSPQKYGLRSGYTVGICDVIRICHCDVFVV